MAQSTCYYAGPLGMGDSKFSSSSCDDCQFCKRRCTKSEARHQMGWKKTCKRCLYERAAQTEARVAELEKTLQELMTMLRECPRQKNE